jgi:hypothetical protein
MASCYLIWVILKSEKRLTTSLIAFWVLFFPILSREEFTISLPWGFDLQPTRIFLVGGLLFLTVNFMHGLTIQGKLVKQHKNAAFEIFMLAYITISSIVILITSPNFEVMVPLVSGQIVFAVMYYISRDHLSEYDIRLLEWTLLIFGIMSVLVALVQFYFDPHFFRISSERSAFGDYIRSNGFMTNEYDNGLLLTILIAPILIRFKSATFRLIITVLFGIGVYLTMHRMSWIIYLVSFLIYLLHKLRQHKKTTLFKIAAVAYLVVLSILIGSIIYFNSPGQIQLSQEFIAEQLFRETLSIRRELNIFGLDVIEQHPEGIGDFNFTGYWQAYSQAGIPFHIGRPLVIHNGFVAAGVKYGFLGGIAFLAFMLAVFWFGLKKAYAFNQNGLIILLMSTSLILINLTQEFSPVGSFSLICFAFWLGVNHREELL